ncbi:MAG: hypothetical protein R3E77_10320 [Steroidobacteraceae bacterium]
MKLKYKLEHDLIAQAAKCREFANGAAQVSVTLTDGRRFDNVLLSDKTYIIGIKGYSDLPFSPGDIAAISQTPQDVRPRERSGWIFFDEWNSTNADGE